jgi:hypothetical protein
VSPGAPDGPDGSYQELSVLSGGINILLIYLTLLSIPGINLTYNLINSRVVFLWPDARVRCRNSPFRAAVFCHLFTGTETYTDNTIEPSL